MESKKVENLMNEQVGKEAYSSSLYLAMASWAEDNGYRGIAEWLYIQSDEERMHMLKFVKYINDRDGRAIIPEIKKPPVDFNDVHDVFEQVLKHEQFITNSINAIVFASSEEKDFTSYNFLQWYVNEQIEEESNARTILDKLKIIGNDSLYQFDRDITVLRKKTTSPNGAVEA
jgi:ferritin